MTAPAPRTDPAPPVARLSGPAELAAALPHLLGFVPTESLVVVTLRGPRRRVGLTMRFDLPPRAHDDAVAADVAERVAACGAESALLVVCTAEPAGVGGLPRARLVRRARRALTRRGVSAPEALLLDDERWWSYVCRDRTCCPPSGTPVPSSGTAPGLAMVEAHTVLEGRAVLPSRQALSRDLAPPPATAPLLDLLAAARAERAVRVRDAGRAVAGREALSRWRTALADGPAHRPDDGAAAALVVSLDDVVLRDEVLTSAVDDDDAPFGLLLDLARRTPPPHDAQVCTLLGWTAHLRGDGATANLALDRALDSHPGLSLAVLARQALDAQVTPAELRTMLEGTRRTLRCVHPWTAPAA